MTIEQRDWLTSPESGINIPIGGTIVVQVFQGRNNQLEPIGFPTTNPVWLTAPELLGKDQSQTAVDFLIQPDGDSALEGIVWEGNEAIPVRVGKGQVLSNLPYHPFDTNIPGLPEGTIQSGISVTYDTPIDRTEYYVIISLPHLKEFGPSARWEAIKQLVSTSEQIISGKANRKTFWRHLQTLTGYFGVIQENNMPFQQRGKPLEKDSLIYFPPIR